jgi:type II secretory pathway component PulK
VDTVDLGRGTWCRARLEYTAAKLDLNLASPEALRAIIANDSLSDALLDWRDADDLVRPHGAEGEWYREQQRPLPRDGPLADPAELGLVRVFDSALVARLGSVLITGGTSQLDLNAAPPELLATLPGVRQETVAAIMHRRSTGRPIAGAEQLLSLLSPPARAALLAQYQEFSRQAVYAAPRFIAVVEGGVRGAVPVSQAVLTLVPAAERLAVIGRRTE